jgi:hypothetical protein
MLRVLGGCVVLVLAIWLQGNAIDYLERFWKRKA